ncbi:MAG TPA: hypothetical protein VIN34_05390 [Candidatus Limnocylindria bacterium]|jgi:hypothetical protein
MIARTARLGGRVSLLVPIIAGTAFGAASVAFPLGDNDVFWQLATARETIAHGLVRTDLFSWTVAGQPVSTDQWLGQLLWFGAYLAAGWSGILGLRALAVALLGAAIVWSALRERPRGPLVAVIAALPALALSRLISVERPELFGFLCFAVLVPLLRSAREGSTRALVALPFLIAVWAELHGSFALGAALVVAVCAEGALFDAPARRRGYALTALTAILATLLTPAGPGVWSAPGFHLLSPPRLIQEWAVPDVTTLPGLVFATAIILTFAAAALTPDRDRSAAVVLLPVLLISLIAVRQTPFFAIAAAPFLARHGSEAIAAVRRAERRGRTGRGVGAVAPPPGRRIDLAAGLAGLLLLGTAVATSPTGPDLGRYPTAALPVLAPGPGLLNDYDWGGFLIWSAPRTPVFVDGRLTPYLPGVVADYTTILNVRPGWREVVARRGVRELLVRPDAPVAVRAAELGWPVRALGSTAVLITVGPGP